MSKKKAPRPYTQLMPPQPQGFEMPFWYSALQSFWLYYLVDRDTAESLLPQTPRGHRLALARFSDHQDHALVSLDFQAYMSGGASFMGTTTEIEFNVYAYPEKRLPDVPLMSTTDYLMGRDQTKTIGGFRVHVPCSNPNAVKAGRRNFGEPKWRAAFSWAIPSLNQVPYEETWSYKVAEPFTKKQTRKGVVLQPDDPFIYSVSADLTGLNPLMSNISPLIEYGTRRIQKEEGEHVDVVAANYWNFFGPFPTYFFGESQGHERVKLTLGTQIDHRGLYRDVRDVIGHRAPIAAQTFSSAPVSSESQAWFESPDD